MCQFDKAYEFVIRPFIIWFREIAIESNERIVRPIVYLLNPTVSGLKSYV